MRTAVIIFLIVLTQQQTSASIFGEVSISWTSWKSSVGKLLSDAKTDLKDTFECTVFAIQKVYSGDSAVPDYYQKCHEQIALNDASAVQNCGSTTTTVAPSPSTVRQTRNIDLNNNKNKSQLNTLKSTPQNDKIEKELKMVKSDLIIKTSHPRDINLKLKQDFDDMAKQVNDDFVTLQNAQKTQSIDKVMEQIKKLHNSDSVHANNSQQEIYALLEKLLTKLDKNNIDKVELKQEIKSVFEEMELNNNTMNVERELKKWKEKDLKEFEKNPLISQHSVMNPLKQALASNPRSTVNSVTTESVPSESTVKSPASHPSTTVNFVTTESVPFESTVTTLANNPTTIVDFVTTESPITTLISHTSTTVNSVTTKHVPSESTVTTLAGLPSTSVNSVTTENVPSESTVTTLVSLPSSTENSITTKDVPAESTVTILASNPFTTVNSVTTESVPVESTVTTLASHPPTTVNSTTEKSIGKDSNTAETVTTIRSVQTVISTDETTNTYVVPTTTKQPIATKSSISVASGEHYNLRDKEILDKALSIFSRSRQAESIMAMLQNIQ